jgi:hypothetical protein
MGVCLILLLKGGDGSSSFWLTQLAVKTEKVSLMLFARTMPFLTHAKMSLLHGTNQKAVADFTAIAYPAVHYIQEYILIEVPVI